MSPTIETAAPDDARAVAHVAAATFPLACPPGTRLEDIAAHVTRHLSPDAFRRHLADPARTVLLAIGDAAGGAPDGSRDVLGYAMLVTGEPDEPGIAAALTVRPTVLLDKFYLLPSAQGTGTADLLLAEAIRTATATGASGLWLGVNRQNARAARFYERHGLRVVGARRFTVGSVEHEDDVRELVLDGC